MPCVLYLLPCLLYSGHISLSQVEKINCIKPLDHMGRDPAATRDRTRDL